MSQLVIERVVLTEEFKGMREEWTELLSDSEEGHLFLSWEWLYTWWVSFGKGSSLSLITVRSAKHLVAIVPMMLCENGILRSRCYSFRAFIGRGSVGSDYLSFIVRKGWIDRILPTLSKALAEDATSLLLDNLDRRSLVMRGVCNQLRIERWRSHIKRTDVSPWIDLSGLSWESYLESLGRSHASGLRRKYRKINARYRLSLAVMNTQAERQSAMNFLISRHLHRWKTRGGTTAFDSLALIDFHNRFSALALTMGWLRLFLLKLDDVPAAAIYGFSYDGVYYYYQAGFDERFSRYSVGQLAIAESIRFCIEEGVNEYDFLHGSEPYKYSWANRERELISVEVFRRGLDGYLSEKSMLASMGIKRLMKPLLPESLRRAFSSNP